MVHSMTGYAQIESWYNQTKVSLEIKTVNHRFLDISLNIPHLLNPYEDKLKSVIRSFFHRGRIDLYLSIEGNDVNQQKIEANWELINQYNKIIHQIQDQYPQTSDQLLRGLPAFSDLLQVTEIADASDDFLNFILEMLQSACQSVNEMRQIEGKRLAQDIHERVYTIYSLVQKLTNQRKIAKDQHYQRMVDRLNELLTKNNLTQDDRFYHELAILAEKGDISEEITRIHSHLKQIELLLDKQGEIGRKMDFITQELIRESNTIGSKANDPLISEYVVELKATVEKIKEQVQNIE